MSELSEIKSVITVSMTVDKRYAVDAVKKCPACWNVAHMHVEPGGIVSTVLTCHSCNEAHDTRIDGIGVFLQKIYEGRNTTEGEKLS